MIWKLFNQLTDQTIMYLKDNNAQIDKYIYTIEKKKI